MAMHFSIKQIQVDRAKAVVVGATGVAVSVVIFSLIASRALLSQRAYQSRVITEQEKAVKQLRENVKTVNQIKTSYQQFAEQSTNLLGGKPDGQGDRDGDNARIILDALPSKYDFPAVATSLEKILSDRNFKILGLTGTDDEIAQSTNETSGKSAEPIEIPFNFSVLGTYDAIQGLTDVMQRSIRPITIQNISFSGNNSALNLDVSAATYYLPEKQLNFPTKEVK